MAIRIVALLDGTLVDPSDPIVCGDDQGVVRGDGVFEALIAVDGEPRQVDEHIDRLGESARILHIPEPDGDGYRRAIRAILDAWDWAAEPQAVVRLFLTRGREGVEEPHGWVMAGPIDERSLRERREGVRVLLLNRGFEGTEIVDLPWLLPGAKSLSYGINMAARRHAMANDADDALFVTPTGRILEAPTASLILDLDGRLVTPPLDGVLRSISVAEVFKHAPEAGLEMEFQPLVVDDLWRARGGWLVSSSRLVARLTHVDGREIPTSPLDADIRRMLRVPDDAAAAS